MWLVLTVEGSADSLNELPGLSLFTFVSICIFQFVQWELVVFVWMVWAFGREVIFSVFGGFFCVQNGDLCELCFVGDFLVLGWVVCPWAVDILYVFPGNISINFSLSVVTSFRWVSTSASRTLAEWKLFQVLLKLWPIIWFQVDPLLHQNSVFVLYVTLPDSFHLSCYRCMSYIPNRILLYS